MSNEINLYCDNAGGLYMSDGETCVCGLECVTGSTFRPDAEDFHGWAAEWVADGRSFSIADLLDWQRRGGASLVATYDSESDEVALHACADLFPGSSAARYLGADHKADVSYGSIVEKWGSGGWWTGGEGGWDAECTEQVEVRGRSVKEVATAELASFGLQDSLWEQFCETACIESATRRAATAVNVTMPDGESYGVQSDWTYFGPADRE